MKRNKPLDLIEAEKDLAYAELRYANSPWQSGERWRKKIEECEERIQSIKAGL